VILSHEREGSRDDVDLVEGHLFLSRRTYSSGKIPSPVTSDRAGSRICIGELSFRYQ
jgi:hypothetical protein